MATHMIDRFVDANGDEFVFSDSSKAAAGTASPLMDGKASVGNSLKYAREDHIHPTDTSRASASHTHGNIQNGGTLQTNDITIANGDKLVVTDSSDSSKVARASISFDGSTTTKALTQKGTWETFNNYSHPAGSAPSKTGVPTANATPGFGGTFKVNQITTDSTSHVSAVTERTITIPNATATTSADGLMSAADKTKLNGIANGAEANVQADWNSTNSSSDAFIKNKPYYTKYTINSTYYKVCSFPATSSDSVDISGIQILARYFRGGINGRLIYKNEFRLYYERVSNVYNNSQFVKFHYVTNGSKIDLYAQRNGYTTLHVAPLVNQPKSRVDFTDFGTDVPSLPEGATEITPVWVANSERSSGTAPVKVNAFGDLTPVTMDSIPTASSTNLMTSGGIKTALDNAVANVNMRYPFGVRQNRTTSYGYRLFNVKFNTAQSATNVRISGNIVVGTTGNNEHISFDLVIANLNTVENNPSSINLLTTSTRRDSSVVRLAYKRPSNWNDGLDVFILWNAEGTATAANDTYGWEITQQEATKPSGVEVKDENLTSALTGFTLDSPRTFAITEGTSAIGSTSVPVYANVNGVITPCTDDFVHNGDVTSTYSSTGTAPVNGTAVAAAIGGLDVSSVGGDGKYISAISETDGKISATATTMDTTPTANSTKAVTSGGIKTALNDKFDKYGFFGKTDGKWIGAALSVDKETEVKYWKLCSFTTQNWWSLNFVADVTNATFDSNVFERKIIAINGSTPGVVASALEIREGNNQLYSTRGYGNIIYYETSGNNVTIYIKARFSSNLGQYCRLVSVLSVNSIANLTWYQETTAGTQPETPVKFSLGYKTVKPAGSASVPVYIGSDGNPTACTDDFVHDGDVTSTYSSTGTAPVNGKAVATALAAKQDAIPDAGSAARPVHFKDGKAVAGDSINNCKLTLKVGDATVGDGFTTNAGADFEYRVTGEQIASALTAGSGIAISGKTVSTNLPLSKDNGATVKKGIWYIFAMANVTGGAWERCWDFLIASNHNSSAQMRLFISPRISESGLIDSDMIVQVEGHVTPAQLEKYKIATVKDSSGKLYCCLCVKHSNSNENRTVQWNLRDARGPSWWGESTPLSNYTVVSERLLSASMSSNRLVCYKPTNNAAVGNATQPVYVDAYGMIKACSSMPKFVIGTPAGAADTIYFT